MAEVRFDNNRWPHGAEIGSKDVIVSRAVDPNSRHTIEWIPWERHYRITYVGPGLNGLTFEVPEAKEIYRIKISEYQDWKARGARK